MKTLCINVLDKVATYRRRDGVIICGNSDYQIKFTFDSEWDAHTEKTARFVWNGQYADVDFTGDTCSVPLLQNTTQVRVGVYAGDLSTTTPAVIECKKSILCENATASTAERERQADRAEAAADRAEEAADRAAQTFSIGENGNWFMGETDTGVKAQGRGIDKIVHIATDTDSEGRKLDYYDVYFTGSTEADANFFVTNGKDGAPPDIAQTTGDSTTAVMSQKAVSDTLSSVNLVDMFKTCVGYENGIGEITPSNTNGERTTDFIEVRGGEKYTVRVVVAKPINGMWLGMACYDKNKNHIERLVSTVGIVDYSDYSIQTYTFTLPANTTYVRVSARLYNGGFIELRKGNFVNAPIYPLGYNLYKTIEDVNKDIAANKKTSDDAIATANADVMKSYAGFGAILASLSDNKYPNIDTKTSTLVFPEDTLIIDRRIPSGYVSLQSGAGNNTCSFGAVSSSAACIYYNISGNILIAKAYSEHYKTDLKDNILLIAYRKAKYPVSPCPITVDGKFFSFDKTEEEEAVVLTNNIIKSINHRGYNTVAPENTLAAFRLSKQKGFEYVECDVHFTADGVPVVIHDATVDRTSNGTGNIADMTLAQAKALDFGSWKSADYAGEKIPTLDEFLLLCRNLGLYAYIELKDVGESAETRVQSIVDAVKKFGLKGKVSYITSTYDYLTYIKNYDPTARIALVAWTDAPDSLVNLLVGLKTDTNEVFLDASISNLEDEGINRCMQANIPVELFDANTAEEISSANPYISGFTCDKLIGGNALIDNAL